MRQPFLEFCTGVLLFAICLVATASEPQEIQVLIDVSGSMKQNDPKNLRSDATQLLISLLPDNAKTKLWLFSENTELLSQSTAIDKKWRDEALKQSKAIHSRGLYTDIEKAIATVLENGFSGENEKNLILLTDGMVDISKDIMVSADSRERILSEWIPRLRQRQIKVQTIALSEHADKELLEKLAFDTDGWNETAESADQLQRLFLKTMQKVAPKDTVPLEDNRFNIDSSIREFSLLVFKKAGASPTRLITPDQKTISKQKTSADNVAWLETPGYDLITVVQPTAGEWQIAAESDPDNQVMILTDLKLQLEGLRQFIGEKDELGLKLYFTEQNQFISRRDFVDLIALSLAVDHQPATPIAGLQDQPGYFATTLKDLGIGKHTLTFIADGQTFKREIEHDIEVISSPIRVEKQIDADQRSVTLKFLPDSTVLDTGSMAITSHIQQGGQETETRPVTLEDGEWRLALDKLPVGTSTSIHFDVTAKTLDGNTIHPVLAPVTIDDSLFPIAKPLEQNDSAVPEEDQQPSKPAEETQAEVEDDDINWGWIIAIVVLANIVLVATGLFAYKMLRASAARKQQQLMGRLE